MQRLARFAAKALSSEHGLDLMPLVRVAGDGVQARPSNSWISRMPEALSSIKTTLASNGWHCPHTARFSSGYSMRLRNT